MTDQPVVPECMVEAIYEMLCCPGPCDCGTTHEMAADALQAALTAAKDKYGSDAYLHLGTGDVVRQVNHLMEDCGKEHCVAFRVCLVPIKETTMSPIRCPICGSFDTIDCGPGLAPDGQHHVKCIDCGCAHQMTPVEPKASGAPNTEEGTTSK